MIRMSIVVPALNEERYIARLLDSIANAKYPGQLEVIVVDGGSSDKTREVVKSYINKIPDLKLFAHERGISKQRNYGAAQSSYEHIIFLDADTEITISFLKKCAHHFETKEDFFAMPVILPYDGRAIDYTLAPMVYLYALIQKKRSPILTGMCIITTKSVHQQLKGFNENMEHAEDLDYGLRAYRKGIKYYLLFDTVIKASVRRLNKMGRVKTMRVWMAWHQMVKNNKMISADLVSSYSFGEYDDK